MAKPPSFSDIDLNNTLRKEITKIGGNPDVVRFLTGWCNLISSKKIDLMDKMDKKFTDAYLKKIKRKASKDGGKEYWEEIKTESLTPRKKMKLRKSLFMLSPVGPNPSHCPPHYEKWLAVFYLREYFKKITGKPKMKLIAKILLPHKDDKDYNPFNSEWYRRGKWFNVNEDLKTSLGSSNEHLLPIADLNGNPLISIDGLIRWYQSNQAKIIEALETGIPVYLKGMTKISPTT